MVVVVDYDDVADAADVVDNDDADNDDTVMTMMMMVAGKPQENETTPLNTNCGYRNLTLYCCCDWSLTRTVRCCSGCYGNFAHFLLDSLILQNLLNLKDAN